MWRGLRWLLLPCRTRPSFSVGSVTRLFEHRALLPSLWPFARYDVSGDGRRFVLPVPVDEEGRAGSLDPHHSKTGSLSSATREQDYGMHP